jgi:hypothetical protein
MAEEKLAITTKIAENYAIVDSKGNILERFRAKATAISWLGKLKNTYRDELKIIALPNKEND